MYNKLQSWAYRRHPKMSHGYAIRKYFKTIGDKNWVFAAKRFLRKILETLTHIMRNYGI